MTKRHEGLLIANGAIIFFLGLMGGFLFIFSLLGEITIWPIPGSIKVQMPADERAWRAMHTGNILNALMLIGAGLALSRVRLGEAAEKFVCWGLIVAGWGNSASTCSPRSARPGAGSASEPTASAAATG